MLLGEILIKKGLLTQAQLDEALYEQKTSKQFLGTILVRKRYIRVQDLVKVLSEAGRPVFLGEMLINKGLLMQAQLELALDEQRRTREFLGAILVRRGYVKEKDFITVLSEQFRIPYVSLKDTYIDWETAMRFPASLVFDRKCMPIKIEKNVWIVAVTNPLDAEAVSEAEMILKGQKMKLVLVTEQDMREAHASYKQQLSLRINKLLDGGTS